MREIGGYIEFEHFNKPMLHEEAIKLNCGRNALAYIVKAKNIKSIWMPRFNCGTCDCVLKKLGVKIKYYSVGLDFKPVLDKVPNDEWLLAVNYYGQLSDDFLHELSIRNRLIVDNAQAYFHMPLDGVDTIYTCRKFFGVSDGAILYTDTYLDETIPQGESFDKMSFLLGRFERNASDFYSEYSANNERFDSEPIKHMSALTENILRAVDYEQIQKKRNENFNTLHEAFEEINMLRLSLPKGAFMYPLYIENGTLIRQRLQQKKIYIPTLWPDVYELCAKNETEYKMAENILPLPVDQRYGKAEMNVIIDSILALS